MDGADQTSFDEMREPDGSIRPAYAEYCAWLDAQDKNWMRRKGFEAEGFFRRTGITFNVYGGDDAEERLIPFDMIPRIISGAEWRRLSRGIEQRVRALNAFMHDLYHRQEIIRAGRLPERLFRDNKAWLPQMVGFTPPGGVYTHIVGIDLVRTGPEEFLVLEDNARTPSGVSYMLENRETMMAMFPELFSKVKVREVSDYPRRLAKSLAACAPDGQARRLPVAYLVCNQTPPVDGRPSGPPISQPPVPRRTTTGSRATSARSSRARNGVASAAPRKGPETGLRSSSASVSRWGVRSRATRSSSCSTSRCPTSMPSCACRCGWRSSTCSASSDSTRSS